MEQQQQEQHPNAEQLPPAASIRHGRRRRPLSCQYLPQELVDHILRRSSLWASTRLQLVSKSWAAACRAATPSHQTPWMFLYTIDTITWSTTGYMASIRGDGGFFQLKKKLESSLFIGSCYGWLAFKDYMRCQPFLLNPFTMARVDPPPLPMALQGIDRQLNFYLYPSGAAAARGCCIVATYGGGLAVWKPGQDKWKWRRIPGWRRIRIRSMAAVDGKLYVLDRETDAVYDVDVESSAMAPLGAPGLPPVDGSGGLQQLVESRGELLLVRCNRAELKGVHRLDPARKEWVELGSLGKDRALFVGASPVFRCALTVSVEQAAGCRGNCVYLLGPGTGLSWTEFDMAAGGIAEKMEPSPPATPALPELFRGVWVSPMLG